MYLASIFRVANSKERKVDPKISPTALITVLDVLSVFFTVRPIQYTQFRLFEMYFIVKDRQ